MHFAVLYPLIKYRQCFRKRQLTAVYLSTAALEREVSKKHAVAAVAPPFVFKTLSH
jgi:hypothetical protein